MAMSPPPLLPGALALLVATAPVTAQRAPAAAPVAATAAPLPYAFHADLVLAAPVIADVVVHSAARIKGAEAAGVAPGATRFYVTVDVRALIRAPGTLPARVDYLVDVPSGPDGRVPKLRDARLLLFARPAPTGADQLQLVSSQAQLDWSPERDALVRRITREVLAADAPARVTGVGSAFHVPGSLPGEGETQIFLQTADARPVSLSVLRRPGEEPRWAVALSEIVDEAAAPPARDTLLWYRLACFLPATLPEASTASLADADAAQAREDYRFVLTRLGDCGARARF